MFARAPGSRWWVWVSVTTAVGLIFLYNYASRSPADSSPAPAAGAATESGVPSSGRPAAIAPAAPAGKDAAPRTAASPPRLAVNGVMITPASRAALISVDDRPAALFFEGQQVADGVVLYALNSRGIVVKRGDELLRLPLRGVPSAGNADAVQSTETADPAQFVPSPDPVQSAASAGVDLPAWVWDESVLSSPPSAAERRKASRHHD